MLATHEKGKPLVSPGRILQGPAEAMCVRAALGLHDEYWYFLIVFSCTPSHPYEVHSSPESSLIITIITVTCPSLDP